MNLSRIVMIMLGPVIGLTVGLLLGHLYYFPRIKALNHELNSYSLVSPLNQDYDLMRSGHLDAALLKKARFDLLNALCMHGFLTQDQRARVARIAHLIQGTRVIKVSPVSVVPSGDSLTDVLLAATEPNHSTRRDIRFEVCHTYQYANSKAVQLQQ